MIKKSTIIVIACMFIFSVVIVSLIGMKAVVYNPFVPTEKIECTNKSDEENGITVEKNQQTGKVYIEIDMDKALNTDDGDVILLIQQEVYPINATNKEVRYVYNKNATSFKFEKSAFGNKENGKIIIFSKTYFSFKIKSTDGTTASVEVDVWAK